MKRCKSCNGQLERINASYHIACEPLTCTCDEPTFGQNDECMVCHRLIIKESP